MEVIYKRANEDMKKGIRNKNEIFRIKKANHSYWNKTFLDICALFQKLGNITTAVSDRISNCVIKNEIFRIKKANHSYWNKTFLDICALFQKLGNITTAVSDRISNCVIKTASLFKVLINLYWLHACWFKLLFEKKKCCIKEYK